MFGSRCVISARWSAVMRHRRNDRRMVPSAWRTRCLRAGEIHEFILCTPSADRSEPMDDVSYLGFAEILDGGVLAVGDELRSGEHLLGTVHGFDETHFPNHYNILIAAQRLDTGVELGLEVGGGIRLAAG
ncbi:DUF6917 domain-containing protein [Amycolatopsis sp. NPDC059657]|uniref:DUF6917 domain-containing protein n=1 Tax=Amycolatopsis sp. NPDC059657 TaxID=3346899 RepID=UPI0036716353